MKAYIAICAALLSAASVGEVKFTALNVRGVDLVTGVTHPEFRTATNDLWQAVDGRVPTTRTVNGYALSSDIDLGATDVNAPRMESLPCSTSTNIINGMLFRFYTSTNKVHALEVEWNDRIGMTVIESATYNSARNDYTGGIYLPASATDTSRISVWYWVNANPEQGQMGVGVSAYNWDTETWIVGSGTIVDTNVSELTYVTYAINTRKPYEKHGYSVYGSLERFYYTWLPGSYVPTTRTVNSKSLSADISLDAEDVGVTGSISVLKKVVDDSNSVTGTETKKYDPTAEETLTTDEIGAHNSVTGGVMNGIYPLFTHISPSLSIGWSKFHGLQAYNPLDPSTTQPLMFSFGGMVHTKAECAVTMGYGANNTNNYSFVWSGDADRHYSPTKSLDKAYGTHYNGGFHVNPKVRSGMTNPLQNFWIGDVNLNDWILEIAPPAPVVLTTNDVCAIVTNNVKSTDYNALGLAYLRELTPTISNTVTKAYVESLGIEAGISASAVTGIVESASVTNAGAYVAATNAAAAKNGSYTEQFYAHDFIAANYVGGYALTFGGSGSLPKQYTIQDDPDVDGIMFYDLYSSLRSALIPDGSRVATSNMVNDIVTGNTVTNGGAKAYVNSVITNTCPAFSNAVLTVGLGISTNEVASIKAMVDSFSDYPIGTGATTIGALLLALAGAVTWLKKHTVKTDGETTQSVSGELIVGDLNVVGGTKFEIVSSVPASPASDTLYFITGS